MAIDYQVARTGILITVGLVFLLGRTASAQVRPGLELQVYPAGVILSLKAVLEVNDTNGLELMAGYNRTNRRGWGIHASERGGGPGLSAAWRTETGSWYAGVRADLWRLDIDWRQPDPANLRGSGTSTVFVLQPTFRAGYSLPFRGHDLDIGAALGREINVRTRGEPVGEGAILLFGVAVAR
jgi:hypothetical protein